MQAVADTSVIVASILSGGDAHLECVEALQSVDVWAAGHAWIESVSVLTRLPFDVRVSPADASRLVTESVQGTRFLSDDEQQQFASWLAQAGVSGGAIYDALVGWVAHCSNVPMLTRDVRAVPTYRALGIEALFVGQAPT